MTCSRCNRPLQVQQSTPVLTVRGKLVAWGPKCAVIAGLVQRKHRVAKIEQRRATDCTGQVDWVQMVVDRDAAQAHNQP